MLGTGSSLVFGRIILQVVQVKPSGILRLQGADGRCITDHRQNVAPCGLLDLDLTVDPSTARPGIDTACELCEEDDTLGRRILLCSLCSAGWHWDCLRRQGLVSTKRPPARDLAWYCPYCVQLRQLPVPVDINGTETEGPATAVSVLHAVAPRLDIASRHPFSLSDPSQWRLTTTEAVIAQLNRFMPGSWSAGHIAKLVSQLPLSNLSYPSFSLYAPTEEAAYDCLKEALNWHLIGSILDPWSGHGGTRKALHGLAMVCSTDVVQRDLTPLHALLNAVEPADIEAVCGHFGGFDGIVASPWFGLLDLALCAALPAARRFVAFHVPGHFVTSAHPARADFLQRLSEEGRLLVISNLPRSSMGWRCAWLIIFSSSAERERLVQPGVLGAGRTWFMYSRASLYKSTFSGVSDSTG